MSRDFVLFEISETHADAQSNMAIASSLGLASGVVGDVAPMDTSAEPMTPFSITAVVDEDVGDELTYRHPMCGGVLSTAGAFDNRSKNVLIVRVSSAGLESSVGEPKKVDRTRSRFRYCASTVPTLCTSCCPPRMRLHARDA
jgi:hypothetical protein